MTTYRIDTAHGDEIACGMTMEQAMGRARQVAGDTARTVYVGQDDGDGETVEAAPSAHLPGTWHLAPATDLSDEWSAGYEGNSFATQAEAEAEIANLSAALGSDTEWVALQR